MASFSNIVLMGNITRDLELRTTTGGLTVIDVNIAVNTYRKGAENNQITTFYRGTMFGQRAETVAKNFKKGDPILLSGRDLVEREWEDKDGNKRTSLEFSIDNFSFVGNKGGSASGESYAEPASNKSESKDSKGAKDTAPEDIEGEIDLSDIPF